MADQLAAPGDLAVLLESDTLDASKADLVIECSTAVIQAAVGQRIVQVVDDVTVIDLDEYDTGTRIALPERPVTAVAAVLIGETAVTDYKAELSKGTLWRACGWRSTLIRYHDQPSTVTITNTHGYPPEHQRRQLARGAVVAMVRGVFDNPTGLTQVRIDDYAAMYAAMESWLDSSTFLIDALRRQYGRRLGSIRLTR